MWSQKESDLRGSGLRESSLRVSGSGLRESSLTGKSNGGIELTKESGDNHANII